MNQNKFFNMFDTRGNFIGYPVKNIKMVPAYQGLFDRIIIDLSSYRFIMDKKYFYTNQRKHVKNLIQHSDFITGDEQHVYEIEDLTSKQIQFSQSMLCIHKMKHFDQYYLAENTLDFSICLDKIINNNFDSGYWNYLQIDTKFEQPNQIDWVTKFNLLTSQKVISNEYGKIEINNFSN